MKGGCRRAGGGSLIPDDELPPGVRYAVVRAFSQQSTASGQLRIVHYFHSHPLRAAISRNSAPASNFSLAHRKTVSCE